METTAIALIALVCTQNNLVCREDPRGISIYETVQKCTEELNTLAVTQPASGYKIVGKCVPVQEKTTGKEWALNWAGEPIGFVERASIRTAEADSASRKQAATGHQETLRTADLNLAGSEDQTTRVSVTLNPEAIVN